MDGGLQSAEGDTSIHSSSRKALPSILVSSADGEMAAGRPNPPQPVRIKSQTASVSRWSESSAAASTSWRGDAWSRATSLASEALPAFWSRPASSKPLRTRPDQRETLTSPRPPSLPTSGPKDPVQQPVSTGDPQRTSNSSLTSMLRRLDKLDFGSDNISK